MPLNWNYNFKWQYEFAKRAIADTDKFDQTWRDTIQQLQRLMSETGFEAGEAAALTRLRVKINRSTVQNKRMDSGNAILQAVGIENTSFASTMAQEPKMRASAIKFLQHVYLLNLAGNRCLWIHSLPVDFNNWATMQMHRAASSIGTTHTLLKSKREQFSPEQKKHLADATQHAMAWVQKTNILLANARSSNQDNIEQREAALRLVRRWFADPATTPEELQMYISRLASGFKAITAMLNRGKFILTDWVPLRGAATEEEREWWRTEAMTFASPGEGLDVIYIEKAFFLEGMGVLQGQKNWTRVIVHELSHLVCGTEDVDVGQVRYAWYGLGPHAGFRGHDAIKNADSWAFFCADCAQALSISEQNIALKII